MCGFGKLVGERIGRSSITIALAFLLSLLVSRRALAQSGISITSAPPPQYTFGEQAIFQISAQSTAAITGVTLFFRTPEDTRAAAGEAAFTEGTAVTAQYTLDLATHPLPPFAPVEYWWEIRDAAGARATTDPQTLVYEDNRFGWQALTRDNLTVHWYQGDTTFGQTALDIAAFGLARANTDIRAPFPEVINIYIYANETDAQSPLKQVGRIWAGGHADPALGVVLVTVSDGLEAGINLGRAIPHELTHLLVAAATGSQYARVPNWLNEGLAVMNQAEPDADYPAALARARETGSLVSLTDLCGPFSADPLQAQLAYAESESAVRYIRDRYGSQKVAALLAAYADGLGCSAGVERALGQPLADLESDWLAEAVNANPAIFKLRALAPWLVLAGVVLSAPALFWLLTRANAKARVV